MKIVSQRTTPRCCGEDLCTLRSGVCPAVLTQKVAQAHLTKLSQIHGCRIGSRQSKLYSCLRPLVNQYSLPNPPHICVCMCTGQ